MMIFAVFAVHGITFGGEAEDDCTVYGEGEIIFTSPSRGPASVERWENVSSFDRIVNEYKNVKYHFGGFFQPKNLEPMVHLCTLVEGVKDNALKIVRLDKKQTQGVTALGCGGYASVILNRLRYGNAWKKQYAARYPVRSGDTTIQVYLHQMPGSQMAKAMGLPQSAVMTLKQGTLILDSGGGLETLDDGLYFFAASAGKSGHVGFVRVSKQGNKPRLDQWHVSSTVKSSGGLNTVFSMMVPVSRSINASTLAVVLSDGKRFDAKSLGKIGASMEVRREDGETVVVVKDIPVKLQGGVATGAFADWWGQSIYKNGTVRLYRIPQ